MARYVLLEFDDNADAEALVEAIDAGIVISHEKRSFLKPRLRGLWMKPTQFCECKGKGKNTRSFTRGTKYGLWVHSACKKPTRGWGLGEHWFVSLGRNLLPVSETAPEYRGGTAKDKEEHFKPCPDCNTPVEVTLGSGSAEVWCPTCKKDVVYPLTPVVT